MPATRTWRNRFVALSVPSTRLRSLQSHPQNLLSDVFKRDLQNTQTAPLAAVCTPTIKLVHRTTKMRKLVVCVKKSCSLFFVSPSSLPDSSFYLSVSVSGHNRILLCFSGMCPKPVMLFRDSVPAESESVGVCACPRVSALGCACLYP